MPAPGKARSLEAWGTLYFVVSGACALVYEVLWFKQFSHVWGSSSLAMAAVVASFLAGLGLGAWLIGARADRMARPLFAYGLCELGIALWAVCVPFVTPWCAKLAAAATPALQGSPLTLTAVRVLTTFFAIAPACLLMGATLPILVRWLATHGRGVGRASAWLYASNAMGAAAGAWAAGFLLMPALGLDGTTFVAAGVNVVVGVLALVTDRALTRTDATAAAVPGSASADARPPGDGQAPSIDGLAPPAIAINAAALLAGFGALTLQMIWGRELALLVGPTTFAFSALVVVFIAGLGTGSLFFALLGERISTPRRWIALAVLLVVVGTLAGRLLEPSLAVLCGSLRAHRASPLFNAALCAAVSSALVLVATFAMGILFPALIALLGSSAKRAGASVGRVYAWNTAGSIAGALCAFTFFVPILGSEMTTSLALGAYVGVLLCTLAPRLASREWELCAAVAALVLILAPWRSNDPRATNLGMYLYADAIEPLRGDNARIVFFTEGTSANVMSIELDSDGNTPGTPSRLKNLRVNGKVDASNSEDMPMQLGTAYFPLLLRPATRSVLVIGMGSGTTVGAALLFPGTEVTCVELEPAIFEASRAFVPENKNPHSSPRFKPVIDDGRNYVQSRGASFDLIISEPSNPWIAGISNLFTREFYTQARGRLARGGMFVQWLQTYGLSAQQHALVANTAQSEFPHVALLRINEHDTLLLCAVEPIVPERAVIDRSQELLDQLSDVGEDLRRYFGSADVRTLLLSVLTLDNDSLRDLCSSAGDGSINTDTNMLLEFNAPRELFGSKLGGMPRPMDAIYRAFDPRLTARLITAWGWTEPQALALLGHKRALVARGESPKAFAINELILAYVPEDGAAMADQLAWAPPRDPEELNAAVLQLAQVSKIEAARIAKLWLDQNQFAKAKVIYGALQVSMPDSPTVLAGLAICLASLSEVERARELLLRARAIDPLDPLVADLMRAFESK